MSATELPEAPVVVEPDEWKHVVVLDKLADAARKPSTNPLLQCVHSLMLNEQQHSTVGSQRTARPS